MSKLSFEDCIDEINYWISLREKRWNLKSLSDIDYDDVSQIIRIHIYKKWDLWDQERPLKNWLNAVITNQTRNLINKIYSKVTPPCYNCPYYSPQDGACLYTKSGNPDSSCLLFNKWTKGKKEKYNIMLSSKLDDPENAEVQSIATPAKIIDYDESIKRFHSTIVKRMNKKMNKFYHLYYVQNLNEKDVQKAMGCGIGSINQMKKNILLLAKTTVQDIDIS